MSKVIYVDVLISVNLIVSYFILLATAKVLKFNLKRKRIILASILASLYSLYIFVPKINIFLSFFIKLLMSLSIVSVAFGVKNKKRLLKSLACFYSSSFGFCGVIFGLWYIVSSDNLIVKNGVVYIDISPTFLLVATILSYIVIRIINIIVGRQNPKDLYCNLELKNDNHSSQIRAKVDTGNTLREPFSNIPVIIAEYKYIKEIMPKDFLVFFDEVYPIPNKKLYPALSNNFRLVPFKAVSSEGILPAFKPDKIIISSDGSKLEREAYIAVCSSGNIGPDFEALVNPELIEN